MPPSSDAAAIPKQTEPPAGETKPSPASPKEEPQPQANQTAADETTNQNDDTMFGDQSKFSAIPEVTEESPLETKTKPVTPQKPAVQGGKPPLPEKPEKPLVLPKPKLLPKPDAPKEFGMKPSDRRNIIPIANPPKDPHRFISPSLCKVVD